MVVGIPFTLGALSTQHGQTFYISTLKFHIVLILQMFRYCASSQLRFYHLHRGPGFLGQLYPEETIECIKKDNI